MVDCPEGFDIQYGGHCYRGTFSFAGWNGARDSCQQMQASLMVIETAGENVELYNQLVMLEVPRVWVGLRDTNDDGVYEWVDGTTTATHGYSNFDRQPDAGEDDCVFVGGASQGQDLMGRWFFDTCNELHFAVCERLPL